MSDVICRTPRLLLRKVDAPDAEAMHAVYGDAEGMRWVGDGKPLTLSDCEHWVQVTHRNYEARGYGMFTVVLASSSAPIGFCGLVHPAGQLLPELKYAYQRDHWGLGYATEAAAALLAYGAEQHGMTEVIATAAPEHTVSHRILLKVGMQRAPRRTNDDGSFTELFTWRPGTGHGAV